MSDIQNSTRKEQGERFRLLLKEVRLTQNKTASLLATKQASISHAINGNIGIPAKWLLLLKMWDPRIDTNWVLTGEGEMFLPASDKLPTGAVMEPGLEYVKSNARPLSDEEVAVMLARLQKEVNDLQEWKREASRAIWALEVKRLKE